MRANNLKEKAEIYMADLTPSNQLTKKFKLTNETIEAEGIQPRLYRIQALRDFGKVKAGDLGAMLQKKKTYHMKVIHGYLTMQRCITKQK